MTNNLSIFQLIIDASLVVQFVMFILLAASVLSWTFIFNKRKELKRAHKITDEFLATFWSGINLTDFYKKLSSTGFEAEGIEKIFLAGYKEFSLMGGKKDSDPKTQIEHAEKIMRIELNKEIDRLDKTLSLLATIGSTSPYVGLFGTVWGIMNSFRALGDIKQATLAHVAPGIAEALIATAMGLFAAIPAVVAYNRFSNQLDQLAKNYELFVDEFVLLLQRQRHSA